MLKNQLGARLPVLVGDSRRCTRAEKGSRWPRWRRGGSDKSSSSATVDQGGVRGAIGKVRGGSNFREAGGHQKCRSAVANKRSPGSAKATGVRAIEARPLSALQHLPCQIGVTLTPSTSHVIVGGNVAGLREELYSQTLARFIQPGTASDKTRAYCRR